MTCKLALLLGGVTPIIPMILTGMTAPLAPDLKGALMKAKLRASDTETLQSQVNKAAKKRLSLSGVEILHRRLMIVIEDRFADRRNHGRGYRPARSRR